MIIAALGATPLIPDIPGIRGENVLLAEDAYRQPEQCSEWVLILGGGLVGAELAVYLAMQGKKPEVVEMLPELSDGGNILHAAALRLELKKYAIPLHFGTRAEEITAQGVRCSAESGEVFFPADTVVCALGQRPRQEEALALRLCAPEFYMIGDCVQPKNIANATAQGHDIAANLGRI